MSVHLANSISARQSLLRGGRCTVVLIWAVITISFTTNWLANVYGQINGPSEVFSSTLADPSVPLPQLPRVEHAVVIGETVYIGWPKSLVGQAALTAVDLKTRQVKWSHQFAKQDIRMLRAFGDQIYCGAEVPRNRIPGESSPNEDRPETIDDPSEDIHDYLFQAETGSLTTAKRRSPKSFIYWRPPIIDGDFLVSDLVFDASDLKSYELDFESSNMVIQGGKLYAVIWERTLRPEGQTGSASENKSDGSSAAIVHGIVAADGSIHNWFIRRLDLKTGFTEVTVNSSHLYDEQHRRWILIAAHGDRVYLQEENASYGQREGGVGVICYDLVREQIVWNTVVPIEPGEVHFRDANTLVAQRRVVSDMQYQREGIGNYDRLPVLIEANTGHCQPDPDWHDPFSLIHWHTRIDSIVQVMKNDRFIVVLHKDWPMMCIDSVTGRRLWQCETAGAWPSFSDVLTDQLVLPCFGGVEIVDVTSGECHRVVPEDIGLKTEPSLRLPKRLSVKVDPLLTHARSDAFYDRQLLLFLGLPLVAWSVFRLFFWFRRGRSETTARP